MHCSCGAGALAKEDEHQEFCWLLEPDCQHEHLTNGGMCQECGALMIPND